MHERLSRSSGRQDWTRRLQTAHSGRYWRSRHSEPARSWRHCELITARRDLLISHQASPVLRLDVPLLVIVIAQLKRLSQLNCSCTVLAVQVPLRLVPNVFYLRCQGQFIINKFYHRCHGYRSSNSGSGGCWGVGKDELRDRMKKKKKVNLPPWLTLLGEPWRREPVAVAAPTDAIALATSNTSARCFMANSC